MAGTVIKASEELIRVAGRSTPNPKVGAAALALALGRVCTVEGIDIEAVLSLVRLAHRGEGLGFLAGRAPEEELFTGKKP
jgi:hypothetical protein